MFKPCPIQDLLSYLLLRASGESQRVNEQRTGREQGMA